MNTYRNFKETVFILVSIVTFSCDPIFYARINNKTQSEIVLELQFNNSKIQSVWGTKQFQPFLQGRLGGGELLCFDSITLISKTLLRPNEFFTIQNDIGYRPDFSGIRKIQIFKNDTITIDSKESMIKSFKKTKNRHFNLDIK